MEVSDSPRLREADLEDTALGTSSGTPHLTSHNEIDSPRHRQTGKRHGLLCLLPPLHPAVGAYPYETHNMETQRNRLPCRLALKGEKPCADHIPSVPSPKLPIGGVQPSKEDSEERAHINTVGAREL